MSFEQCFYDRPCKINLKLSPIALLEINIGGPYRKCGGGINTKGSADYEIRKRKIYAVRCENQGVTLSLPEINLYSDMFSETNIGV